MKKLLKEENTRRTGVGIVSEIINLKMIVKKLVKE